MLAGGGLPLLARSETVPLPEFPLIELCMSVERHRWAGSPAKVRLALSRPMLKEPLWELADENSRWTVFARSLLVAVISHFPSFSEHQVTAGNS